TNPSPSGPATIMPSETAPPATPTATPTPTPVPTNAPDPVDALLSRMTVDQRIGQLLMPYAYGASATSVTAAQRSANRQIYGVDTPAELVSRYHLGGLILLPRNTLHPTLDKLPTENTTDPTRVPALTDGLQHAALNDSGVPLLIATDQEEGLVTRIGEPLAVFPGSMPLGATRDQELARRVAAATGSEMAALGVNLDLAPDADVNVEPRNPVIGLRSFGDDAQLVAGMVTAQVAGYQQDAGIGATVKHFPGHGDTTVDSHTGLPRISHDRATLQAVDLPPFASAITNGVDVVMAGHLLVPALDPNQPATLSSTILTDLLRSQLGFKGVVMTDSLWMAGIRSRVKTDADAALDAFRAGADILLMPPAIAATVARFHAALDGGQISESRLNASVRRILALKQRLGLLDAGWRPSAAMPPGRQLAADRQLADQAAAAATTLVACGSRIDVSAATLVIGLGRSAADLAAALPDARAIAVDFSPTATQRQAAVAAAGSARTVVLLTYDAGASAAQRQLLASLAALNVSLVAVSIDLPYDLAVSGAADVRIATYGAGPVSMRGLATALGANRFGGRLPVTVPAGGDPSLAFGAGLPSCG
ncbi:MAG TPA: glycoside hydrolase family 3 protein, partial [Candidatus Limnocylindria bacterium]|nr:glycoside hydrolase family 3 protein [Candidatus Limnocylindria bacterium]